MFGDIAYPLFSAYSASKFGLRGLSIALRRELKQVGVGITYAAPRATNTDAAGALARLVSPRLDDPAKVARDIWAAVARDADSVYAKGPERLLVLVQQLFPGLIDRSIEGQMSDARVRACMESNDVQPHAPGANLSGYRHA
jgi:short-subunit dehydrogenase